MQLSNILLAFNIGEVPYSFGFPKIRNRSGSKGRKWRVSPCHLDLERFSTICSRTSSKVLKLKYIPALHFFARFFHSSALVSSQTLFYPPSPYPTNSTCLKKEKEFKFVLLTSRRDDTAFKMFPLAATRIRETFLLRSSTTINHPAAAATHHHNPP